MWGFGKTKEIKGKIINIENNIRTSFQKVKDDFDSTNAWLNYYYQRSLYLENLIASQNFSLKKLDNSFEEASSTVEKQTKVIDELAQDMAQISKEVSGVKEDISHVRKNAISLSEEKLNYHIEKISREILKVDRKVEDLSHIPVVLASMKEQLNEHIAKPHSDDLIEKKIHDIQEKLKAFTIKKSPKEKLVQKVTKSSHDYLKAMILSYIKKYEKISAFQLREMVVEEQNLTSKSTFYRLLEEIESLPDISTIKEGKEKVYLSKLKKHA